MKTNDAVQAPTVLLVGIPTKELKELVLSKLRDQDNFVPFDGTQFLAAVTKQNVGIFIIDGNFSRAHFKQALLEADAAGINKARIEVYATTSTYSGAGIDFEKFESIGIRNQLEKEPQTTHNLPPINLTPSWGEVGNIFYRLAATSEMKAIKEMKREMARAFAGCEAYSQLTRTFTPEQAALAKKVFDQEMAKQGFA